MTALQGVTKRMKAVVGKRTYAEVSSLLGFQAETTRRYVLRGLPAWRFLQSLRSHGYSIDWLLSGEGTMLVDDRPKPLAEIPTRDILIELVRRRAVLSDEYAALKLQIERAEFQLAAMEAADGTGAVIQEFKPAPSILQQHRA